MNKLNEYLLLLLLIAPTVPLHCIKLTDIANGEIWKTLLSFENILTVFECMAGTYILKKLKHEIETTM